MEEAAAQAYNNEAERLGLNEEADDPHSSQVVGVSWSTQARKWKAHGKQIVDGKRVRVWLGLHATKAGRCRLKSGVYGYRVRCMRIQGQIRTDIGSYSYGYAVK